MPLPLHWMKREQSVGWDSSTWFDWLDVAGQRMSRIGRSWMMSPGRFVGAVGTS